MCSFIIHIMLRIRIYYLSETRMILLKIVGKFVFKKESVLRGLGRGGAFMCDLPRFLKYHLAVENFIKMSIRHYL